MDLCARIAAWRASRGLSRKELAKILGVVPATVFMWESTDYAVTPSRKNMDHLLEVLGVDYQRFYGRVPKVKKP